MQSRQAVLDWLEDHRDAMTDFLLEFANVPSPRGEEREASEFLHEWLGEQGIAAQLQPVTRDRPNVIGRLEPTADRDGDSLLFNAHIDTGFGRRDEDEQVVAEHHPVYSEAWRDGSYLFGDDVANDKGPMTAFLWAALALRELGVDLGGDLVLTATVGEIGGATVDEFQDPSLVGTGIGTRRLVDGGVTADYAVVAETTDYAVARMECGVAWFKITVEGDVSYQARIEQPAPDAIPEEHPGALPRAAELVLEIERWAHDYQREHTTEYDHGTNRPSAGVGAFRSGNPHAAAWAPGTAAIYLDVRLPPGEHPEFVADDIRSVIVDTDADADVESYMFRRGYVADDEAVTPLVDSIGAAHDEVRGGDPPRPDPAVTSMWRDLNVFNEVGIPAVTVGPPRSTEDISGTKHRCLHVDDLLNVAKLYALTALEVCREE